MLIVKTEVLTENVPSIRSLEMILCCSTFCKYSLYYVSDYFYYQYIFMSSQALDCQ